MARRDWFVREESARQRWVRRTPGTRRGPRIGTWLAIGVSVAVTFAWQVFDRRGSAQAVLEHAPANEGRLVADVVETRDLERDSFGHPQFEGWGARSPRLVPAALKSDILLLRQHGSRVRERRRRRDLRPESFPDLPIADDAPQRMDSGHPDPDRLLPSSRPAVESER